MLACCTKAPATSLNMRLQIDLLLVMAAHRGARLLAGDRQHRHVIQPRVVKPVSRCDAPGPDVAMHTPTSPVNLA